MKHPHSCNSSEHALTRRQMLQSLGVIAGATGVAGLAEPIFAQQARRRQKQVLFVWLDGAMSQLESWDPKPGTQFGGPFKSIQTRLPGVRLSELMPRMAERMNRFAIVRSMHTRFEDHSQAVDPIQRGDPKNRGVPYPFLGSAVSKLLGDQGSGLPPYIHIKPGSGGFFYQDAGFLGAEYGALTLGDGNPPANLAAPEGVTAEIDRARSELREAVNQRFLRHRTRLLSNTYEHTFRIARQMMNHRSLFDPARLGRKDLDRYGGTEFGRHMLQARRLLEAGVTFVKVTMYHWDTHGDNFNCHLSGVPQVDQALSAVLDDLTDRGMYEHTVVVVLSEFGRTPKINGRIGRDHWPECWSLGIGGGGIRPGVVIGATSAKGTFNAGAEYDIGHVFHTIFRALGINPDKTEYDNNGQPLPIAHEDCSAIRGLLA
ncbi:MAG: DUF1501 domain-containing protein [Planctomycetes bacterium]|nr:DUF1501 domain-containing protein [Planctomycetota bacterium]